MIIQGEKQDRTLADYAEISRATRDKLDADEARRAAKAAERSSALKEFTAAGADDRTTGASRSAMAAEPKRNISKPEQNIGVRDGEPSQAESFDTDAVGFASEVVTPVGDAR